MIYHCFAMDNKKRTDFSVCSFLCWHLPIFPGSCPPSIFGASELNFRVRDGNGWTLTAINTDYHYRLRSNKLNCKAFSSLCQEKNGDPYGNRTHVCGVRGRRLNRLTNGPLVRLQGFEPGTHWLRVSCSTNWAKGADPYPFRAPSKLNKENFRSASKPAYFLLFKVKPSAY